MSYITPEQFVARLGYSELLLYSDSIDDSPSFASSTSNHIVRAKEYTLFPKQPAHVDVDVVAGIPDRNIFYSDKVSIDGNIKVDMASNIYNALEYTIARLFDHMRQTYAGIKDDGTLISPREDLLAEHPMFTLGSAYHGTFSQCLVNSFDINITNADDPVELDFGVVATKYNPANAFTYQGLQSVASTPSFLSHSRRLVYGRDCVITSGTNGVIGHFGVADAKNSVFSSGPNKPAGDITYISAFNLKIENNLEPQYTMHSHEISDHRARFAANVFPHSYAQTSARKVTGSLEWFGNISPTTFLERLMGPASVQNRKDLIINCKCFKIELKEPVWHLSEKPVGLDMIKRTAEFSVASDGALVVPYYSTDY
jgi:hypothetical protein